MTWMSARTRAWQPRAARSQRLAPIPASGERGRAASCGARASREARALRRCSPHPPSARGADATAPLLSPAAPFRSPPLLPGRRPRLSPSLATLGPLLPFCSGSSRRPLSRTHTVLGGGRRGARRARGGARWRRRGGEGGEARRPPRARAPQAPPAAAPPPGTRLAGGVRLSLRALSAEGSPTPNLSREPSAPADRGNQKLCSCSACCQQRQLLPSPGSPSLPAFTHPLQLAIASPSGPLHGLPPLSLFERTLVGRLCAKV